MTITRTSVQPQTVTARVQRIHQNFYGASDNSAQNNTAASKSLNYANGPTLQRPEQVVIYAMPTYDKWEDEVGLFGAENKFIHYTYSNNTISAVACFEDVGYECAQYRPFAQERDPGWTGLTWNPRDFAEEETYAQAEVITDNQIPDYSPQKTFVSVEIVNHKTGNIYNDDWLDVRLYAKDRMEHPYSKMYVPWKEPFYAGFHARNTRRLPYNVDIVIGKEIVPLDRIEDKRLIRRTIEYGTQF